MDRVAKVFIIKQRIELSEMVNGIIWALRKIPLVGKFLGDKYKFSSLKYFIHRFYPIFAIIKELFKSALACGIVFLFVNSILSSSYNIFQANVSYAANKADFLQTAYSYLMPLYLYWLFALFRNIVEDSMSDLKKYYQNFRMNPEEIVKANLYFKPLMRFFARSIILMGAFHFLGKANPLLTLTFSFILFLTEIEASVFWMNIGLKGKKKILSNGFFQTILAFVAFLILSHLILFFGLANKLVLTIIFIGSILGFAWSVTYLKNFDKYGLIIEKSLREYNDLMEEIDASPAASVKLKDKDIDNKKVKGEGFAYLNNIFFRRHRRILLKPVLIKSGILAALFTILISFLPFFEKNIDGDLVEMLVILVPLATYMLCKQDNILTAFFINCDQGLIPYGFYRHPTNLLTMYRARLVSLLKINAIPAIVYVLGLVGVFLRLNRTDYIFALEAIAYILLAGVFFTSLPLAQYYLFQPFNAEGAKVGKISGAIDMVVYIFCFNAIRFTGGIKTPILVIGSSIFILLFTIITSLLILKIGPKTFRLKN